jgi:uracil phosphoribosyltransferase
MPTVLSSPLAPRILRRSQIRSTQSNAPLPKVSVAQPQSHPPFERVPVLETRPPMPAAPAPAAVAAPAPVNRVHIIEHPAAHHALTLLHSDQLHTWEFRAICNQLLILLAVEATRSLPTIEQKVETSTGSISGQLLAKPVVFLSVTRDGLGLSHNLSDCVPGIQVGGISIERTKNNGFQSRLHLASAPALNEARVILFDPAVSSGTSAGLALSLARRLGATDICLLSFMISSQALCRLQADFSDLNVWTAGIDSAWEPKKGVSVLGNFGERLYR